MAAKPLDLEYLRSVIELVNEVGTQAEAARVLGIPETTLNNQYQAALKAARQGKFGTEPVIPGFEITKETAVYDQDGKLSREFIQQKPEKDVGETIPAGHNIKGVSTLLDGQGRVTQQWVKTHQNNQTSPEDAAERVREAFKGFKWKPLKVPPPQRLNKDFLTIYPIADLHLALRASISETGEESNLQKAKNVFLGKSDQLFLKSPPSSHALVAWLGDNTHQDNDKNETPRSGHKLEVSDNIFQTSQTALQLGISHCYRALERHNHVTIKVIKGNHDPTAWIAMVLGLAEHFRDDSRVTVDTNDADYWFFRWGKSLLGIHHGHRLKPIEMAGAMAHECRVDWGETDFRLFLHGHLHHRIVEDHMGVQVECMRTLASPDAHHAGKYGSPRSLCSITLSKEYGEDSRSFVHLKPITRLASRIGEGS